MAHQTPLIRRRLQSIRRLFNQSSEIEPFLFTATLPGTDSTLEAFCVEFVLQKYTSDNSSVHTGKKRQRTAASGL